MKNLSHHVAGLLASLLLSLGFRRAGECVGTPLFACDSAGDAESAATGCVLPCAWA